MRDRDEWLSEIVVFAMANRRTEARQLAAKYAKAIRETLAESHLTLSSDRSHTFRFLLNAIPSFQALPDAAGAKVRSNAVKGETKVANLDQAIGVNATDPSPGATSANDPDGYFSGMAKWEKGSGEDAFGCTSFAVNLTRLPPGGECLLWRKPPVQNEFILILKGAPTLVTQSGEMQLIPGMCAGSSANGEAHHLVNRTDSEVLYLERGDGMCGRDGV